MLARLAPRLTMAAMALACIIASVGYRAGPDATLVAEPFVFGAAGVACAIFAARPHSVRWWVVSFTLVMAAAAFRASSVAFLALVERSSITTDARHLVALSMMTAWLILAPSAWAVAHPMRRP